MQRVEQRDAQGDWHPYDLRPGDPGYAKMGDIIKSINTEGGLSPWRWVDAPCPRCGGAGEYEVEYIMGPRIF